MDKKESLMLRVLGFLLVVWVAVFLSGCYTLAGVGKGVAVGAASAAEGVAKDSQLLWGSIQKADTWVKENLW